MEPWTIGKVSNWAKRGYEANAGSTLRRFIKCRGGWRMIGWQSEIDKCRAFGRGGRYADGLPIHRFDRYSDEQKVEPSQPAPTPPKP